MEDNARIGTLIDYWMKHNEEHAETYMKWAAKAASAGNEKLSRILVRLYLESKRLNRLFEAAKKAHGEKQEVRIAEIEDSTIKI